MELSRHKQFWDGAIRNELGKAIQSAIFGTYIGWGLEQAVEEMITLSQQVKNGQLTEKDIQEILTQRLQTAPEKHRHTAKFVLEKAILFARMDEEEIQQLFAQGGWKDKMPKKEDWIPFHKVAAQLLKEDPKAHLHTLAAVYAKRTKVPPKDAQMLIDAFSQALKATSDNVTVETFELTKESLNNLEQQKSAEKDNQA